MCNAANHPPGCRCGWGGDGHLGRKPEHGGGSLWPPVELHWSSYRSFVNPNARCPRCGADVFYYQSPDGGRVFFDEMGPPWPKHACTDSRGVRTSLPSTDPRWKGAGWAPLLDLSVTSFNSDLLLIRALLADCPLDLYVGKPSLGIIDDPRGVFSRALIQAKLDSEERYLLSAILPSLRIVNLTGYLSSIKANAAHRHVDYRRPRPKVSTGTSKLVTPPKKAGRRLIKGKRK